MCGISHAVPFSYGKEIGFSSNTSGRKAAFSSIKSLNVGL
jgi:hypothetical protein